MLKEKHIDISPFEHFLIVTLSGLIALIGILIYLKEVVLI